VIQDGIHVENMKFWLCLKIVGEKTAFVDAIAVSLLFLPKLTPERAL